MLLRHWGLLVLTVVLVADFAGAAEWGTINPGESTMDSVRARYGEPTRTTPLKVDDYDVTEWIYEGDRAPGGMTRLSVEFGLLAPAGFRPEVVRLFRLEPTRGVFTRQTVLMGWGRPARTGSEGERKVFFYEEGLLVEFDREGWIAQRMTFMPRQPHVE